jgi:hypothetical protein
MFKFAQRSKLQFVIILTISLLIIGLMVFGFITMWQYSLPDLCENNLIEEKYSPDNKHKILIFKRNCGATTKESLQVELVSANTNITNDSVGNILVMDSGDKIFANWTTNDSLAIFYRIDQEVYKKETEIQDIEISYYDNTLLPAPDLIEPGIIYDRDGNPIYEIK